MCVLWQTKSELSYWTQGIEDVKDPLQLMWKGIILWGIDHRISAELLHVTRFMFLWICYEEETLVLPPFVDSCVVKWIIPRDWRRQSHCLLLEDSMENCNIVVWLKELPTYGREDVVLYMCDRCSVRGDYNKTWNEVTIYTWVLLFELS